jgi:hypothetical protein
MGGGLMQLVAYGAQDIYLTGNPQITFWKVVYRRHTNFARESIQQTLNGSVASNARVTAVVSRNGDLLDGMHLEHTLDATAATVNESATDIDNVEIQIGGQQIDKHYGKWMETWAELTENKTGRTHGTLYQETTGMGMGAIVSNTVAAAANAIAADNVFFNCANMDGRIVYTPLQFWFCRNPGLALPLIALQYHEVKVIVQFSTIQAASPNYSLWCDYVYLDTDERRRFAQVSHEYLIEQVQHQNFTSSSTLDLVFNHPVKELIVAGQWGETTTGVFEAVFDDMNAANSTMKLRLNGHDRMASRQWSYFCNKLVHEHHSGQGGFVDGSVAVYPFALEPEEHQPSGTCNFSRIDTAQLSFGAAFDATSVDVYAVNYNVLRIMSGMGGLAYSN